MSSAPPGHGLRGELKAPYGDLIHGWVWNSKTPKRRWWVEILLEDLTLAVVEARLHYPGLAAAGIGDGCHGFCFALPSAVLSDPGTLSARIANTDHWLPGTHRLTSARRAPGTSQPQTLPLDGNLVIADGGLNLHGWVSDPSKPGQEVTISCHRGNEELSRATTDARQRFTLALPLSLADGLEHRIEVLANGRPMPGSPLVVLTHPRGTKHLFQGMLERIASGTPVGRLAAEARLIDRLLEESDARLPKGVSYRDYAAWFDAFEAQEQPQGENRLSLLVLIRFGPGLERTLRSLVAQTHSHWQVRVLGHPSGEPPIADPRISFQESQALRLDIPDDDRDNTLITFVEAGDRLPPQALSWVAQSFAEHRIDALYTDCDQDGPAGERTHPWLKPSWDFDLFQAIDYVHHLFVARGALLQGVELQRLSDLPFIAIEALLAQSPPSRPWHLPRVLYHRRYGATFGPSMGERRRARLQGLLTNGCSDGAPEVLPHPNGNPALRQVVWGLNDHPKVSVLIPTRDRLDILEPCVESLLTHTRYPSFELLILDNDSQEAQTRQWLAKLTEQPGCRVLRCPGLFNYSRINNLGAEACDGEVLCLLNNDTLVPETSDNWLQEMVGRLRQPGVGVVGAKLIWANHMVQHAGVVLGIGGVAGHIGNDWMDTDPGYQSLNQVPHAASAVTAACLLTHRSLYLELGGLDEDLYPVAFNDVDYCLRVSETGRRVLWTPFATLYHLESQSRGLDHEIPEKQARARRETTHLQQRWAERLGADPYYHPSLSLYARESPFAGLALPPRTRHLR